MRVPALPRRRRLEGCVGQAMPCRFDRRVADNRAAPGLLGLIGAVAEFLLYLPLRLASNFSSLLYADAERLQTLAATFVRMANASERNFCWTRATTTGDFRADRIHGARLHRRLRATRSFTDSDAMQNPPLTPVLNGGGRKA